MKTYKIKTPRLILRCYEPTDAGEYLKAVSDSRAELSKFMKWAREEETVETNLDYYLNKMKRFRSNFDSGRDFKFGIFKDGTLIGTIGVHLRRQNTSKELGYWIKSDHCGNGYATEAVNSMIHVLFQKEGQEKVIIKCNPENHISMKIPINLGFHLVPNEHEELLYRLRNENFEATIKYTAWDALGRE